MTKATFKSGPVVVARDVLILDLDGNPVHRVTDARISLGDIQSDGDTVTYTLTVQSTEEL